MNIAGTGFFATINNILPGNPTKAVFGLNTFILVNKMLILLRDNFFTPLNFTEPEWVIRLNRTWRGEDVEEIEPTIENTPIDAEQPTAEPEHQAQAEPQQEPAPEPEPEQIFGYSGDQLSRIFLVKCLWLSN